MKVRFVKVRCIRPWEWLLKDFNGEHFCDYMVYYRGEGGMMGKFPIHVDTMIRDPNYLRYCVEKNLGEVKSSEGRDFDICGGGII